MLREAALTAFAAGNHAVARVSNKTRRVSELACRPRVLHRRKKGAEAAQQVASIPAKPPGSAAQTGHDETQESSCWLTIRRGALARSRGTAAIYAQLALRLGTRWHRLGGKGRAIRLSSREEGTQKGQGDWKVVGKATRAQPPMQGS